MHDNYGINFSVTEIIELYLMSLDFKVNKFTDRILSVSSPSFVYEGETVDVKSRRVESVEELASSLGNILRTSSSNIFVLSFSCHTYVSPEDFTEQKSYLMRYALV